MSAGGRPRVTCDIPHDDGATPRHFSLCTSTAAATATSGATVFSTLAVSHMFTRFSNNVSQYLYTVIYYISFIIYNDILYSYFFLSSLLFCSLLKCWEGIPSPNTRGFSSVVPPGAETVRMLVPGKCRCQTRLKRQRMTLKQHDASNIIKSFSDSK
jgi:hypothetical protein